MSAHSIFWVAYSMGAGSAIITCLMGDAGVSRWKRFLVGFVLCAAAYYLIFGN